MLLTKQGEIIEKLPEGSPVEYDGITNIETKYRVRVICANMRVKQVLGEEDYSAPPTPIQILYCLLRYKGNYCSNQIFAAVEKIYTLECDLPGCSIPFD
jgi:hypothetical protein